MNKILAYMMRFFSVVTGLLLGGFLLVHPVNADTEKSRPVEIIVAKTNLVRGPKIFLGDICLIHADSFLKEVLQKIEIGNAPKPGKIKDLRKKRLLSLIQSQQGLPVDALIEIPENIYVKRDSQQVTQEQIRQQVNIFLADFLKDKEYELEWMQIRELDFYPGGELDLSLVSRSNVDEKGNFSVFMDILIDGNKEDSIRISGKVAIYEEILCVARNLAKGEAVFEKDVYFARKRVANLRGDVVRTIQELNGKVLKTNIQKDHYIKASWLEQIPLIQKGDIVSLVARKNNILIVTSGISKEDGYMNKLIRVENIESGKVVRGVVREKTTVEVIY
ncbi:MAG: flagellar basal body P-ring formation protein FlgA [Desulfobacteraceae bacterium]|nr:flagellar basal body P-ring formation protein FlgA [Desulfobacteraceae bacterium]